MLYMRSFKTGAASDKYAIERGGMVNKVLQSVYLHTFSDEKQMLRHYQDVALEDLRKITNAI